MSHDQSRVLSVAEAAAIIYDVSSPSEEQLGKVRIKLQKGHLQRSFKGGWTTTPQAVADYLAARAKQRQDALHAARQPAARPAKKQATAEAASGTPRRSAVGGAQVTNFYQHVLRDYFLALALRRRVANRSRSFHRAVIAGQAIALLSLLLVVFWGYRQVTGVATPERIAVVQWLDQNAKDYQIVEWFPAEHTEDGDAQRQRVRYKYFSSSRKGIVTDRLFQIRGGVVTDVSQVD